MENAMERVSAGSIMGISTREASRITSTTAKASSLTKLVVTTTATGKKALQLVTLRRGGLLTTSTKEPSSKVTLMVTVSAFTLTATDTMVSGKTIPFKVKVLFTTRTERYTLAPLKETIESKVTSSSPMVVSIGVTTKTRSSSAGTRESTLMVLFLRVTLSMARSMDKAPIPSPLVKDGRATLLMIFCKALAT